MNSNNDCQFVKENADFQRDAVLCKRIAKDLGLLWALQSKLL